MHIRSVRHRGLLRLIEDDDARELRPDLVRRLRNMIAVLTERQSRRHLEHLGQPELVADLRHRARRDLQYELGGLPLMNDAPVKIGMAPPHPGAFIREEILDELGLSVSKAADVLGVRRATLSDLINGNAALSAEMALRIEKAFGVKMETLLNMQAWHDAHAIRQRADEITVQAYRAA